MARPQGPGEAQVVASGAAPPAGLPLPQQAEARLAQASVALLEAGPQPSQAHRVARLLAELLEARPPELSGAQLAPPQRALP